MTTAKSKKIIVFRRPVVTSRLVAFLLFTHNQSLLNLSISHLINLNGADITQTIIFTIKGNIPVEFNITSNTISKINITTRESNLPLSLRATVRFSSLEGSRLPVCLLSITPRLYVIPFVSNFKQSIVTSLTNVDSSLTIPDEEEKEQLVSANRKKSYYLYLKKRGFYTTLKNIKFLRLFLSNNYSIALKLYTGFILVTISAVGLIFSIISSIDLYAIGDSSNVATLIQVE